MSKYIHNFRDFVGIFALFLRFISNYLIFCLKISKFCIYFPFFINTSPKSSIAERPSIPEKIKFSLKIKSFSC